MSQFNHEHYLRYKDYQDNYRRTHPQQRRITLRNYIRTQRMKVINQLGNKCSKCGFEDVRALQVDHINGGGTKELKSVTRIYWNHVLEGISTGSNKYQLLCANCNWIKKADNREVRQLVV